MPSERSERAVIPSERSESRDLHILTACSPQSTNTLAHRVVRT
jgi:hypothetical protein